MLYIEKEIIAIQNEHKESPRNSSRLEGIVLKKTLMFLTIFLCFFSINTYLESLPVPLIKQTSYVTWKCKKCGYENYNEISNCGVCGKNKRGY